MEVDIPLTDLFWCPRCGFKGAFKAEPVAYVQCICGFWWVIGDYEYFLSLTREEREGMKTWFARFYSDQGEINQSHNLSHFYS